MEAAIAEQDKEGQDWLAEDKKMALSDESR